MAAASIPMLDLAAQRTRLEPGLSEAIERVLTHGQFIMGPEVEQLEIALAASCGASHAVTCANGTDALVLVMLAEAVGPGDAVVVPSFTFVATAEAVVLRGAVPVFADVDPDTFNIDPESAERALDHARTLGLRPRMVVAVDLFGEPADYGRLQELSSHHGVVLTADAAQSFGAAYHGRPVGTLADYTTTSFFPSKPLGCYGDGGAVLTEHRQRAAMLRSLRVHGKGADKYDNVRVGVNSRLDTIQAAILLHKLALLPDEIGMRQYVADRYRERLPGLDSQATNPRSQSAWAQFTVRCATSGVRSAVQQSCDTEGVATAVYYPRPLHRQTGYQDFPRDPAGLVHSECLSDLVLSLPMYPYLEQSDLDRVCTAVRRGSVDPGEVREVR